MEDNVKSRDELLRQMAHDVEDIAGHVGTTVDSLLDGFIDITLDYPNKLNEVIHVLNKVWDEVIETNERLKNLTSTLDTTNSKLETVIDLLRNIWLGSGDHETRKSNRKRESHKKRNIIRPKVREVQI